jgi:S1-C subfamily serine protease
VPITVACPSCSRRGTIPDGTTASAVTCPACGTAIRLVSARSDSASAGLASATPQAPISPPALHVRSALSPTSTTPAPQASAAITRLLVVLVGIVIVGCSAVLFALVELLHRGVPSGSQDKATADSIATPAPTETKATTPSVADRAKDSGEPADKTAKSPADRPELSPAPAPRVLTTTEIVDRCDRSVANIQGKASGGTGFLVRRHLLATNAHVIEHDFSEDIEGRFPSAPDTHQGPFKAEIVYEDSARDLAFLRVKADLPALEVAPTYKYVKGEDVLTIGCPGAITGTLQNAVSRGVMSTKVTYEGQPYFQLGMPVNHGNSGGPVFDSRGRVIGVVTLKEIVREAVSYCVPVEDLDLAIRKVESQGADGDQRAESQHRAELAFALLTEAGATYAGVLDVQRVIFENIPDLIMPPRGGDLATFDERVKGKDDLLYATLPGEASIVQQDPQAPAALRKRIDELAKNYSAMKSLFHRPGASLSRYKTKVKQLKAKHLELVESIRGILKIEVPEPYLAALQDDNAEGLVIVIGDGAQVPPGVRPDLRDRFNIAPPPGLRDRSGLPPASPRDSSPKRGH